MTIQGGQSGQGWEKAGMEAMKTPGMMASQVTPYLKQMDFPTDKQKIIDMAKSRGAPDMVVQWLNKLPNKQYSSSAEIEQEFSKMK